MIHVAHIMPTEYLSHLASRGDRYRLGMSLGHLVLTDPTYRQLYDKQTGNVDFTILDNSAFELGEAIADSDIISAAELISPDEIVLPDVLLDPQKTRQRIDGFVKRYKEQLKGKTLMAVPHGSTIEEYLNSYKDIASLPFVSTIGIGAIYNHRFANDEVHGREVLFDQLDKRSMLSNKPHHLLGLGDNGNIELARLSRLEVIRSCDSSAAYVQARNGTIISAEGYKKDRTKVDFNDLFRDDVFDLQLQNMDILEKSAQ